MVTKGIRGAITVEKNTEESIKEATLELLKELVEKNNIDKSKISHAIFTLTDDLNAVCWDKVAMMCYQELDVPNSLKMCLRILIVLNCEENFEPQFVYLKGASHLRK